MKRIIVALLIMCIPVMTLAVENKMQQDDESLIRGVVNSPIGRLSRHHASLKLDYISSKLNKGQTVYSQILDLEKKYSADNAQNKEVNQKYIKQLKDFYMFIASYPDEDNIKTIYLQNFQTKKIVIPDSEYSMLDEDLKILLSVVNVFN